jgi:hypothetical protein
LKRFLRDHSLSIVMFGIFAVTLLGLVFVGYRDYNNEQSDHGEAGVSLTGYVTTGHFSEAVFENWESEFLQMGAYVVLTVMLFQRGSAESKDPDSPEPVDEDPRQRRDAADAPWPVHRGGLLLRVYEHSLAIALFALFLISFVLHAIAGAREYSLEQAQHGGAGVTTLEYVRSAHFWFESLQNWQSEFLAVGAIVVLSIFLRQRGSPESKPVAAPHAETGSA